MSREALYAKLDDFIAKGYLKEYHRGDRYTIFHFLQTAYVGFHHDDHRFQDPADAVGVVMTEEAALVLIRSDAGGVLSGLYKNDAGSLAFTKRLLTKCESAPGRMGLKRQMRKRYHLPKADEVSTNWIPDSISGSVGRRVMEKAFAVRSESLKKLGKTLGKLKVLGAVALACACIAMCALATGDWREQFDEERPAALFDKNAGTDQYAYVEIDHLVPLAELFVLDVAYFDEMYHGTYYIWGNRETGDCGILKFKDAAEESRICPDGQEGVVFKETVILYGAAGTVPSKIASLFETLQRAEGETGTLPGGTITMPDGSEIHIPDHIISIPEPSLSLPDATQIDDNSDAAAAFLEKQGLVMDAELDLGANYLVATVAPEKITAPLNVVINALFVVGLGLALVLLVPIVLLGIRADKEIGRIDGQDQLQRVFESIMPVIVDHHIHIKTAQFAMWLASRGPDEWSFEYTATIPLVEKTPTVFLFEDGIKTRRYVLQTVGDEDLVGKFFHVAVRLSLLGKLSVPVAQIDGFVSDTPEDRKMTMEDIGYRMEGHFLACGGRNGEAAYHATRGQSLEMKALKYPGYTTPSNVRLVGICPECGKSFCFHGYAFYMKQNDVAYSDDGLDCCEIRAYDIDEARWTYTVEGKTFRYYNSFNCPHCGTPYLDYARYPSNKVFGVPGCVHLGRKPYRSPSTI